MNDNEYQRVEARLEEALAIFAEKEAEFTRLVLQVRDNVARVRREVAELRSERARTTETRRP